MSKNNGQFKKGQHWRDKKPYWDKAWLYAEYIVNERSARDIAEQFGCKENNVLYFLKKHNIPTRTMSEVRTIKHWGASGKENGMYGRTGEDSSNWKGGVSPERQAFYSSRAWAEACSIVWKRDLATCQKCKERKTEERQFHIHHIVSFENKELRAETRNLVLLCRPCHRWVHSKKNKNKSFIKEV